MRKYIKSELYYGIYSQIYIVVALILLAIATIIIYSNCNQIVNAYHSYRKTEEYYNANHIDIEDALSDEYTYNSSKDGEGEIENIENPLRYYRELIGINAYIASPSYAIPSVLEYASCLFFPLLFGILGIITGTYDTKYKTKRIKAIRLSKSKIIASKQIALIISSILIVAVVLFASYLISFLLNKMVLANVPLQNFDIHTIETKSPMIMKIMYGMGIALLFSEIGLFAGTILKGAVIPIIILFSYSLMIPNLGRYDLKNIMLFSAQNVYDYSGSFAINKPFEISHLENSILWIFVIVITLGGSYLAVKKRSSYNC